MRFTVTTSADIEEKLAAIWNKAPDRAAVSRASNQIDVFLRSSPLDRGRSFGEFHMLTIEPLTVVYEVLEKDCAVRIVDAY